MPILRNIQGGSNYHNNQGGRNYQQNYSRSSSHARANQTGASPVRAPPTYSYPVPTAFTPLPFWNQPYLPPGVQIPTTYLTPTIILKQPWPTGIASQQHLLAPTPHGQPFHAIQQPVHQPYYSNTVYAQPQWQSHATQPPAPARTYAEVAGQRGVSNAQSGQT